MDAANQAGVGLTWAVNSPAAGLYSVSIRYALGDSVSRPAVLQTASNEQAMFNFDSTGRWISYQVETQSLYLAAGNNIVNLDAQSADGLANIDAITFTGVRVSPGQCPTAPVKSALFPAAGAVNVNPDTRLRLNFDNKPVIKTGNVLIFDAQTNTQVDSINLAGDTDSLGFSGQATTRTLKVVPAQVIGNAVVLNPHSNKLQLDKRYYVVIANGVLTGNLGGKAFTGYGPGQWQFGTKASGPSGTNVTVDDDGSADFGSVQGALNYMMQNAPGSASAVINIKNGQYPEPLYLRDKSNLRLVGESREGTVIRFDNYEALNSGSSGRPLFLIANGDMISLENLTIFNTHLRNAAASGSQAEAVYFGSDTGRFIAKNAAFISEQDTLQLKGYSWFYNSLVAGNVDFIWGSPRVSLFENSEIRSLGDSQNGGTSTNGGYVLQARITSQSFPGFIFLNSKLTRASGPLGNNIANGKTYLARSGFSSGANNLDSFAFINCAMDSHVASVGWFTEANKARNPAKGTATFGYREYGTTDLAGARTNLSGRDGAYVLSQAEFNQLYANRGLIFASFNNGQGWNPQP